MNIRTKYNIGDEVWVVQTIDDEYGFTGKTYKPSKVARATVEDIDIKCHRNLDYNKGHNIGYVCNIRRWDITEYYLQDDVFPTEEKAMLSADKVDKDFYKRRKQSVKIGITTTKLALKIRTRNLKRYEKEIEIINKKLKSL